MVCSLLGEKRWLQPCACLFASHVLVFLSHFVSRDHFKSEVSCGSPMASASWALLPVGELCSNLIHDICLHCDGPVSREAAMVCPSHASSCLSRLCFFWISLSLCFSLFWWFRAEERHLSVMSRDRRRKRHPRHHQVAERRRCAGTGPLQRSVIHDIIKLLNGEAGLWVGVVTGTRKTHIITFLVDVF